MECQDKLLNKLNLYQDFNEFPRSNIFVGEKGCGKHALLNLISDRFNINIFEVTDTSTQAIQELYSTTTNNIYLIDIINLSNAKRISRIENSLLKLIEEPPSYSAVVLFCENTNQLLDTVLNRCQLWEFERYPKEFLKTISPIYSDFVYDILNTPGKLLEGKENDYYVHLYKWCEKIIRFIGKANYSNTLTLEKIIDFECKDVSKYPMDLFCECMLYYLKEQLIKKPTTQIELSIKCTSQLYGKLKNTLGINKKYLFDSYLLNLKEVFS